MAFLSISSVAFNKPRHNGTDSDSDSEAPCAVDEPKVEHGLAYASPKASFEDRVVHESSDDGGNGQQCDLAAVLQVQ